MNVTTHEKSRLNNPTALDQWRAELYKQQHKKSIRVCIGTGCAAKGARRLYELFCEAAQEAGAQVNIEAKCVGCHGFSICRREYGIRCRGKNCSCS